MGRKERDDMKHGNQKRPGGLGWLMGVTVGALLLYLGAVQGEMDVIWKKAVMICMECIGIG